MGSVEDTSLTLSKCFSESGQFSRVLSSHGFGEVSKHRGVTEIDFGRVIISQHPREDVVLVKVIKSPTTIFVELHDILKIRKTTFNPLLGETKLCELLGRLPEYLERFVHVLEVVDEEVEVPAIVEEDEPGRPVVHEDFDGVDDLGKFAVEYFLDLAEGD